jgi:hypothetical protein
MQGREAGSQRDIWDKPAKEDNPDREKPRSSKEAGVEHKASNFVSEKHIR